MTFFGSSIWQPELFTTSEADMKLMYEADVTRKLNKSRPTDGCTWYCVPREDGAEAIRLIYTAPYRVYSGTDGKWKFMKLLYAVLTLAGLVCAAVFLALPGTLAGVGFVDTLMFLYLLYTTFFQVVTPRRMTIYQHRKGVLRFRICLVVAAVITVLSFVVIAGYTPTAHPALLDTDITHIALAAASALCTVAMLVVEFTRKCPEVPNDDPLPKGAEQI